MADGDKGGFWTSFPGVLTGIAAVLTAVGGLALALNQAGLFQHTASTAPELRTRAPGSVPATAVAEVAKPSIGEADNAAEPAKQTPPGADGTNNLLSSANGGHLVAASSDDWQVTIDGDEASSKYLTGEGVYAFKDGVAATFDTFGVLVPSSAGLNLAEYELSASDASPTGPFRVIGRFKLQNIKMFDAPYQEAHFPTVTARYLRMKIINSFDGGTTVYAYEFRARKT